MDVHSVVFESDGLELTGLSPSFDMLKRLDDGLNLSQPTISEVANGFYRFTLPVSDDKIYVAKIDGGATVLDKSNRYKYKSMEGRDSSGDQEEVFVMPVYDADADSLTFFVYLLRNGKQVSTGLVSVTVSVYNSSHTLQWSVNTSSNTNGVFIVAKSTPGITAGDGYYLTAAVQESTGTVTTVETYKVLE